MFGFKNKKEDKEILNLFVTTTGDYSNKRIGLEVKGQKLFADGTLAGLKVCSSIIVNNCALTNLQINTIRQMARGCYKVVEVDVCTIIDVLHSLKTGDIDSIEKIVG